jgi:teichuronic acid biosynthesis glycosyltransferase TuaG
VDALYSNEVVSVIIPVYNAEKYIGKTLESALNQTYRNVEIVLVDDCSKDNSRQVIESYTAKYNNVIYHLNEKNGGAAVARNTALQIAKGRYVAFLDSDDLWYPNKIERQLGLMKQKNAAICYTSIEMIDEYDKLVKGKRNVLDKVDYKFLLKNTMIATSTVIIDRHLTGSFQMPLIRSGQDYATWLKLMRNGTVAYGINEVLVKYRKCENSLSSNKIKSVNQVWHIQTKNENINPFTATLNLFCFIINALKKHYL